MVAIWTTLLTLALSFAGSIVNGQVNDQAIRQRVLQKAIVDSTFIFGEWTENGGTETHLKYLGQFTTKKGRTFKILNFVWIWGLSQRATSRILVFDNDNRYVGNYYVTTTADLPTKLQSGKLIFENTDNDCDRNLTTVVDLKRGLPKKFFRECNGKYGDIYSFDNE